MHRFLRSAWFPFLTAVVLAGITAAAFALLKPSGDDVGNTQILEIFRIVGWTIGPVAGLLLIIIAGILNVLRRIVRLRDVAWLHPVIVLIALTPWLVMSWQIAGEPRYTPLARAAIDFAARPLLWGSFAALALTLFLSLPLLFPRKR